MVLVVAGCGEAEPDYRLTSVLPSPTTPGSQITAYGKFPTAAVLTVAGQPLKATLVPQGLRFDLPEAFEAGNHTLVVRHGTLNFTSKVQVLPRLDGISLEGDRILVRGAGWSTQGDLGQTRIELDGTSLTPQRNADGLEATLPEALSYGQAQVRVRVNGEVSESKTLLREAGSVKGSVQLPALSQGVLSRAVSAQATPNSPSKTLLAYPKKGAVLNLSSLVGLLSSRLEPTLRVYRLEFSTLDQAATALGDFQQKNLKVEYEPAVQVLGSEAIFLNQADPPTPDVRTLSSPSPGSLQWHLPLMNLEATWQQHQGQGVVVGVVDTGAVLDHPDLRNNLLPGWDFVNEDSDPSDTAGHGTHVAGLVAADGAVKGVAPKARLLPVRSLSGNGPGSIFAVARGILWAAGVSNEVGCTTNSAPSVTCNPNPAQVINLSLGVDGGSALILEQAVARVQQAGVLVVAASGNNRGPLASPASLPGVISVTALAGPRVNYQPFYANTGVGLQLTAFGGDTTQDQDQNGYRDGVLSTDRGSGGQPDYGFRMGTSMAAPLVSGLAALVLGSGVSSALVADHLSRTATDLGVMGYDELFGFGLASSRAIGASPRLYVLALDQQGVLKGWSLVQTDLSFRLDNLNPGISLRIQAASDADGDGVLGEMGELVSSIIPLIPKASEVLTLPTFVLNLSDGSQSQRISPQKQP